MRKHQEATGSVDFVLNRMKGGQHRVITAFLYRMPF